MRNDIIIEKILVLIAKIQRYCEDLDYDQFCRTEILAEACVFNLSQMGEMVNRLSDDFEEANPQIPWRQIYGLRNRIIHDYEGVNLKLVWEIIINDLPELKDKLLKL